MIKFTADYGEDIWILENCKLPEEGVFVEVGAYEGINGSNTYALEQCGWTGLCIEPNPRAYSKLIHNRKCLTSHFAISSNQNQLFYINPTGPWSGFNRTGLGIKVPVRRLDWVLNQHDIKHVDLMSVDTEGTEFDVLGTCTIQPQILIIEHKTEPEPSKAEEILKALSHYSLLHQTEANLILELVK